LTRCRPSLCARRYENISVGPSGKTTAKTTDVHLDVNGLLHIATASTLQAKDDSNNTFYIGTDPVYSLWSEVWWSMTEKDFTYSLYRNLPRAKDDWAQLWERISDVITQAIRSPANPNATRIYGEAYGPEIFVRVRWEWFIVPISLVVGSNIFLCLTIYHNRKNPYLYKNSVMAILFHSLEGWHAHELIPAKKPGKETYADIVNTAGNMRASFRRNSDGVLKLKRE
jgi:hypothetical protein